MRSTSCGENAAHFVGFDVSLVTRRADRLGDAGGRGDAKVGAQQHVLQLVERQRIELALGENLGDALGDRLRGSEQAAKQPLAPGALGRLAGGRLAGRRFARGRARAAAEQARENAPLFLVLVGVLAHELLLRGERLNHTNATNRRGGHFAPDYASRPNALYIIRLLAPAARPLSSQASHHPCLSPF